MKVDIHILKRALEQLEIEREFVVRKFEKKGAEANAYTRRNDKLGGGFKYFLCASLGKWIQFDDVLLFVQQAKRVAQPFIVFFRCLFRWSVGHFISLDGKKPTTKANGWESTETCQSIGRSSSVFVAGVGVVANDVSLLPYLVKITKMDWGVFNHGFWADVCF